MATSSEGIVAGVQRGVVRGGELTEESLTAALHDERERGMSPRQVAVGGFSMERVALGIIGGSVAPVGALSDLAAVTPAVVFDPAALAVGEWELRG
jgi:hypothetical protein